MSRFLCGCCMVGIGLGAIGSSSLWLNVMAVGFVVIGALLAFADIASHPHPDYDEDE